MRLASGPGRWKAVIVAVAASLALTGCWNAADLVLPPIQDLVPEGADAYVSFAVEPHRPLISEAVALAGLPKGLIDQILAGAERVVGASKDGVFVLGADVDFPQSTVELGLALAKGWRASGGGFRNAASGLEISAARGQRIVVSTGDVKPFVRDYLDRQVPELPLPFLTDSARYDALIYVPDARSFLRGIDPRFASAPIEDLTLRVSVEGDAYLLFAEIASVNTLGARFAEGILKVLARNMAGDPANPLAGLAGAEITARGKRLSITDWRIPRSALAAVLAEAIRGSQDQSDEPRG